MSKGTPKRRIRAGVDAKSGGVATDSYTNLPARLGAFTDNLASQGQYPLTRISQNYQLMVSLYRSAWIVRRIIDAIPEDMLKDMPRISSAIDPDDIKRFQKAMGATGTQGQLMQGLKWGRLFGGAVCLMAIKGHDDLSQPLELDDIEPGAYRGLIPFDRWAGVSPGPDLISDLDYPREYGLPRFYRIHTDGGVTTSVHHSRVLRFTGRDLPKWEAAMEQHWGLSEVELIYDEMQKRDYTSWNIVSLITRAQILTMVDDQLAQNLSGLTTSQAAAANYFAKMQAISDSINNQGMLVLPKDGSLQAHQNSFGGLADICRMQMLDMCAAAETPMSKLYGDSPTGLGQTGAGDLQTWDNTIGMKRERELRPQIDKLYPVIAMSAWGMVPEEFEYDFPPLREMSSKDRAELGEKESAAIVAFYNAGLLTKREARREAKDSSADTGLFTTITDDDIEATPDTYADEAAGGELDLGGMGGDHSERSSTTDADFNEAEHPRDNDGKFSTSGGTSVRLTPAKSKVFTGKPVETSTKPSKLETGALGEKVTAAYMLSIGLSDVKTYDQARNNAPIDLMGMKDGKAVLVECKTGLVSNGDSAQQWRATVGQPGKEMTEWLKTAGKEEKQAHNKDMLDRCLKRKMDEVAAFQARTGLEVESSTITTIINPDTRTADVYHFKGFHSRIAWNSPEAKAAYRGTYAYADE